MRNPTNKGRVSRVSLTSITPETHSITALRAQTFAARFALPIEIAAIVAGLYFTEAH